ncbi:MAG: tRNA pseudouridine synthase A [Methanomassiliicoccales archaeon PtaU1.Bin124]|nr:MAG: tRNA pseudouridine synthase A [Methanomassiliicoccales archaeon PtaU1.Bin124]
MPWTAAVKIAYPGEDFMGSQRQPGERTVEGEVLRSLMKVQAIASADQSRFRVASRTDRGVSALGNVVCFDTDFRQDRLLHALNAVSEGVYYHSLASVPHDFSPRRAKGRWYRYFLPSDGVDVTALEECARLFEGRHDFRRFCKPEGKATIKTLESVSITPLGEFLVIDLRAREFLRNMVRRCVAAMDAVGRHEATLAQVNSALQGEDRSFGLAPADNLVLMDVHYDVDIVPELTEPLRSRAEEERRSELLRLFFHESLLDLVGAERRA